MSPKSTVGIMAVALLVLLSFSSLFTVMEGQRGLVLRLGELVKVSDGKVRIYTPGLHFKMPFITSERTLDIRLQTLDVDSSRILTAEQKYVLVDYYAKWRISNLALYYKRTGGYAQRAQELLTQKINDALRAAFGTRTIKDVIADDRLNVMTLLKSKANQSAAGLGITVTDVRIKGIDLPKEVRDSVFQRMSTEREQVATKHRSQGLAQAETIRANSDAQVAVTVAKAQAKAQQVRAEGDKVAAMLYARAYDKNASFYAFYRSLEAYKQVFSHHRSVMVLKPDSEFFRYFNKATGTKTKK